MPSDLDASDRVLAQNRRARHEYFILETFEAGLVLAGTEVKSLRQGKASLGEAYAGPDLERAVRGWHPNNRHRRSWSPAAAILHAAGCG